MTTLHATQYMTNAADALNSDTPTKFWAMFMPTLTEDPTNEHSHSRQVARADMCLKCHGSEEKACNPQYGDEVEDLKSYTSCMSKTNSVNNALKCNAESLHFNIIEPNERTSLGFTGSARAQTLYATISLGVGFCLLFTSAEVLLVRHFLPVPGDENDDEARREIITNRYEMLRWIKFALAVFVTFFFLARTVLIASQKETLELSTDYLTKHHGIGDDKIHANWNEIDNTDIYCLVFLLVLIVTLMGRKSHMYVQAAHEKIAAQAAKESDASTASGGEDGLQQQMESFIRKNIHEYKDANNGRSAIDLGIVFAFQFYIWYALVQNNRVVLDTMLQKQLVAGAAIGIVYLLSTEICTALFSVRHLRAIKTDDDVVKEPLIAWHAAVITLASFVFIFFFYFFALYEDILDHQNDDDSNVLQSVFALLVVLPQGLQLLYCLGQAFGMQQKVSFSGFQVFMDVLKVGLLAAFLIAFHSIIQADTRSKDLLDDVVKSSCTSVTGCTESVFKFRASSWMHDLVALSNDKKSAVHADGKTMHAYLCGLKLYPSYNCL